MEYRLGDDRTEAVYKGNARRKCVEIIILTACTSLSTDEQNKPVSFLIANEEPSDAKDPSKVE